MSQSILTKSLGFIGRAWRGFVRFGNRFGWVKVGLGLLVLVIGGWTIAHFASGTKAPEEAAAQQRTVEVRSVSGLASDSSPLSVAGTVSSKSEASVRAEIGGQITHVYGSLGSYVSAGSILAEVENASQRAAVAQAQGAVDAATAGASVSQTSLGAARQAAVNALLSAYGVVDKSVHADTDPMFSNPESPQPHFNVQSSDSQAKINAENARSVLGPVLAREQAQSAQVSSTDNLALELDTTTKELRQIRDYLDTIVRALNSGIAANGVTDATIAGYSATASAARASVTAALSALAGAQAGLETASKSSDASTAQSSSQAALTQAQAGLAAARAGLEKTIVRAPISGTLNSFSLKIGDYLAAGTVAAVIANNGALEIVTYVTDTDAREIAVGNSATIENNGATVKAVVTRIAPAIDPATKKIEVRIGITEGAKGLVNGQSATVSIARSARAATQTAGTASRITIPIAALKIGADATSVFTVDENNTLVPHTVTIGTLLGDRVVITSGITPDMTIVTDARGLRAGQTVVVK